MQTRLSKNGMITLPSKIRKENNIAIGDRISFIKTEEGWLLIPVKKPEDLIHDDEMDLAIKSIESLKQDHLEERQKIKKYLFDTGAITLYFANHNEIKKIFEDIQIGRASGIVPKIILVEYYYKTWQIFGKPAAELRTNAFRNSEIHVCDISDDDIFNAGKYKVRNNKFSIADCIAISCAVRENATILTTEDEMKKVKHLKVKKLNY